MSQLDLSIGNELKDSFKPTDKWVSNGINWLSDIESFYRERALIEKEYSTKLSLLCKKHFDKKAKISTSLSVGDDPQITPGSIESASLVLWTEVLNQTEQIALEKSNFSRDLNGKVSDQILSLQTKCEKVRKRIVSGQESVLNDRDKVYEELNKSKKHYDALCQSMENTRLKNERSASDKTAKRLKEKEFEMNNGKNEYLININIANRIKDKYFYQDLPEILDYYQDLNESRITTINKLFKSANTIERNSQDIIKQKLTNVDTVVDQNLPRLDTSMFIKHNLSSWSEPKDFYYIPSSIWHDDENLIITDPELNILKKRLNKSYDLLSNFETLCIDSKQSLEEFKATKSDKVDFDKIYKSVALLEKFILDDNKRILSQVEIEIIQNYAGDKDLTYIEPTPIKKSKFSLFKSKKDDAVAETDGLQRSVTIGTMGSHKTINSGMFNLRKDRSNSTASSTNTTIGRALFNYEANADDEISVSKDDKVSIVEADKGSGWTKISNNGDIGLVPTSYLEIISSGNGSSNTPKKKGPSVAPRKGSKKVRYVEALYDYVASGDDEISLAKGDRIILIHGDNGGWSEGDNNGDKGLFPSSYVKEI